VCRAERDDLVVAGSVAQRPLDAATTAHGGRGGIVAARTLDDITGEIVDAAFALRKGLGPGLLESVYETVLARDLQRRGFQVERQKAVAFEHEGMRFDDGLRVNLLVYNCVIVEIKSVERLLPVHPKQVLTYLASLEAACGIADQLRCANAETRVAAYRQRARSLRVSA
jgi:iron complex transport system substrate-binding protein